MYKNNTMKIKSLAVLSIMFLLSACVPQRKYLDLETKYNDLEQRNRNCDSTLNLANNQKDSLRKENLSLMDRVAKLRTDSMELNNLFASNRNLYNELKDSYDRLIKNNKSEEDRLLRTLKDLEEKLKEREKDLLEKEANLKLNMAKNDQMTDDLKKMQQDLMQQQSKVKELQSVLDAQDSAVKALKNTLSNALLGFKDKGLSVEVKNGKVYVSMEEKLLFATASIVVDKKGKEALMQLAESIKNMDDINIMVEGHTDDVPITTSCIKDNWDLSVLRATSILRILVNEGNVDGKRFVAAGRGEFYPIDPAKTPQARAKNRRTEIIISPKLDEVLRLLESN